jgi:hypothetical protein
MKKTENNAVRWKKPQRSTRQRKKMRQRIHFFLSFFLLIVLIFLLQKTPVFSRLFVDFWQKITFQKNLAQEKAIFEVKDEGATYGYWANLNAGNYRANFWNKKKSLITLRLTGNGYSLLFTLLNHKGTSPEVNRNYLTFRPSRSLEVKYTVHQGEVKEEIILKRRPSSNLFTFRVIPSDNLIPASSANGWHFLQPETGEEVFWIPKPTVVDRLGRPGAAQVELKGHRYYLTVDESFLRYAAYPVTIDPTVKVADTTSTNPMAYVTQRKLFRTSAGQLVLFYQNGTDIAYKTSTDGGNTWSSETTVAPSNSPDFSAYMDSNNNIYLIYYHNDVNSWVFFKKLTYSASTQSWTGESEKVVENTGVLQQYTSIVKEPTGRIWGSYLYSPNGTTYTVRARYSDDGGNSWASPYELAQVNANSSPSLLLYQGKAACAYEKSDNKLVWRQWDGVSWGEEATIVAGENYDHHNWGSWTTTRDGRPHLVYASEGGGKIAHTVFDGSSWSTPTDITTASGDRYPSLTTDGVFLWCFWSRYFGPNQYQIVYKKFSGTSWDTTPTTMTPADERSFDTVFTFFNSTPWEVNTRYDTSFRLTDGVSLRGNQITGNNSFSLMDSSTKFSAKFVADQSTTITAFRLYVSLTGNSPTYRFGIQSDSGGNPSGSWLNGNAYVDTSPTATGWFVLDIPDTTVTAGSTYHLVVEYSSGTIDNANYISVFYVTPNVTSGEDVLTYDGSTWNSQNAEPTYVLDRAGGTYEGQSIYYNEDIKVDTSDFRIGERYSPNTNYSPTGVAFFMKQVGNPGECIASIYDSGDNLLTTGTISTTTTFSWSTATISANLTAGNTYYIVLEASGVDANNYYVVRRSDVGDSNSPYPQQSWGGDSTGVYTHTWSLAGWNDKTSAATNLREADVPLFYSQNDAIYLGMPDTTFTYIYFDLDTTASSSVEPAWEYWNSSTWASLTLTRNSSYDFTYSGGVEFTSPSNWSTSSVNGVTAYWVRVRRTTATLTQAPVANQVTAIRKNLSPSTFSSEDALVGVAWGEGGLSPSTVRFNSFSLPHITNVWAKHIYYIKEASPTVPGRTTITWNTDIGATSQVVYDTTSHASPFATYAYETTLDASLVITHTVAIENLTTNTFYYYRTKSTSSEGELAISPEYRIPPGGAEFNTDFCAACHRFHTAISQTIPPSAYSTPLILPVLQSAH